ncbi:AT08017p [Strongyloides ratti]|uniref:AT08017p n=1 Tax=Strongyloides ratti TaxID=34506 RepID=A0A090L150_STRRB|nr:AT08017p [Strongyloides ratti]CEF63515.1 AT08017p [Strongyloides ratti]
MDERLRNGGRESSPDNMMDEDESSLIRHLIRSHNMRRPVTSNSNNIPVNQRIQFERNNRGEVNEHRARLDPDTITFGNGLGSLQDLLGGRYSEYDRNDHPRQNVIPRILNSQASSRNQILHRLVNNSSRYIRENADMAPAISSRPYTIERVREEAVEAKKWLLVCIKEHSNTSSIHLNNILHDTTVRHVIDSNYSFVSYYKSDEDGQKLKMFYKLNSFPIVLILDPRTGEEVATVPSNVDATTFCDYLLNFIDKYSNFLDKDAEYKKIKRRFNGDCNDDIEQPSTSKKFRSNENDSVNIIVENGTKLTTIDQDDYKKFSGYPSNESSPVYIIVQFPDGKRLPMNVYDNATLKALFLFIGGHGYNVREFYIIYGYPKKMIDYTQADRTLKSMGFGKRELIFIDKK